MAHSSNILMPKLGLTMTEGKLSEWRVGPGDTVRAGDILFTVETDKIANEVEARADGEIITIKVTEGETVAVGTILASWTGPGDVEEADMPPREAEQKPKVLAQSDKNYAKADNSQKAIGSRIIATPLARRRARQLGVDLSKIVGQGARGQIKAADVERSVQNTVAAIPYRDAALGQTQKASRHQQIIARRLTESKQTIPHFYLLSEANINKLDCLRRELNSEAERSSHITLNHFIIAALARALVDMPTMNAIWNDEDIVLLSTVDIGIAIDGPHGLVAPLLRDLGAMGLGRIAAAANDLVTRARDGQLLVSDMDGGAVSISNVGMFGATSLVPIINPGQSAILGVGRAKPTFRPDADGQPQLCQELSLVLSCDHRLFNGVEAAKFLDRVRILLENPLRLLL